MQRTVAEWSLEEPLPHNVARGNVAMSQLNAASMMRSGPIPTKHNYAQVVYAGILRRDRQGVTMRLVQTEKKSHAN